MDQQRINETLLRNTRQLSEQLPAEQRMMPQGTDPLPSVEEVRQIVALVKNVIFTDYLNKRQSESQVRSFRIGVSLETLYGLLCRQIARGMQFSAMQIDDTGHCGCGDVTDVECLAEERALAFLDKLPEIKRLLLTDVEAMFQNDPAASNYGEVIYCYPVVNTMTHYRIAHALHEMHVPVIPRIITEQAHSKTGIDIHPGATIGEYFAIDHGTGVVIGETAIIGNHVTLYQGVTLGAKSFRYDADGNMLNIPRHPIIEDHVTIYSNASILGRITIGHDTIIGGNVWVTHDLPPFSRVQQSKTIDRTFQGGLGI